VLQQEQRNDEVEHALARQHTYVHPVVIGVELEGVQEDVAR